jgi:chromosome segregation ATPase
LENLRKQHETKISEWKELVQPQEEQLRWLKEQPGLREEQIEQVAQIESFLAEHNNAISNSEQSIRDIDEILSLLNTEKEICAKSLAEWNDFLRKEQMDIQELGSPQRYVTEKLTQVKGDTNRSRFELISYARRLLKLDPTNQSCQQFLDSLVGSNNPGPAAAPTKTANRPRNSNTSNSNTK